MVESKVCIVGGGISGISAAIQLHRFGLSPILIEKKQLGGLILQANLVENYPGFINGISGRKFGELLSKHVIRTGVKIVQANIMNIRHKTDKFILGSSNKLFSAEFVVLATGTVPRKVPYRGHVPETVEKKIVYEISSLLDCRNKKISIVGGGDAAFDYALNLSIRNEVLIHHRSTTVRALDLLQERAKSNPAIHIYPENELLSVSSVGNHLKLKWQDSEDSFQQKVDYLLFATGRIPQDMLLNQFPSRLRERLLRTGKLHAVGDLINGNKRQLAIAAGQGIDAAMKINYLLKKVK